MSSGTMSADVICGWQDCPHGDFIKKGDVGYWVPKGDHPRNPDGSALKYHADCFSFYIASRGERPAAAAPPAAPPIVNPTTTQPAAPAPASSNAADLIKAGLEALIRSTPSGLDREAVSGMIEDRFESLKAEIRDAGVIRYQVTRRDGVVIEAGTQHEYFPRLLDLMVSGTSTYLWGPPGTGKTQAAIEAAKALGLDYAVISMGPQSPASKLEGFLDAQGRYTDPDFHRLYTAGGVFIVDEMDNMSAAAAGVFNSALANGVASFPCGMVSRHPDFIFIGTGNTSGRGPTPQFPERRKLDTATTSRLRFVAWPADRKLELSLALAHGGGADEAVGRWVRWVQMVRDYIARPDCGIGDAVHCDMRAMISGAQTIAAKRSWETIEIIAEGLVLKGLSADKCARIIAACPLPVGVI